MAFAGRLAAPSKSAPDERVQLELSGPKLRSALETLTKSAELLGGIEVFAHAARLKSEIFIEVMGDRRARDMELAAFEHLTGAMSTVRRRIAKTLGTMGWPKLRRAIEVLLEEAQDTSRADVCLKTFGAAFPDEHRYVRDLAAEVLHNVYPELYPLMNRWVWDRKNNTGVIREIWHADDVDRIYIDVPDAYPTFLMLREELSQFLSTQGFFRDMIWYVDILCAQIYGEYISAQGGAYLKTDFSADIDPLEHSRRILGLDAADKPGRSRFKTIDEVPPTSAKTH